MTLAEFEKLTPEQKIIIDIAQYAENEEYSKMWTAHNDGLVQGREGRKKKENSKKLSKPPKLSPNGSGHRTSSRNWSVHRGSNPDTNPIQIPNKQPHSEQELPLRRLYGTRSLHFPGTRTGKPSGTGTRSRPVTDPVTGTLHTCRNAIGTVGVRLRIDDIIANAVADSRYP